VVVRAVSFGKIIIELECDAEVWGVQYIELIAWKLDGLVRHPVRAKESIGNHQNARTRRRLKGPC